MTSTAAKKIQLDPPCGDLSMLLSIITKCSKLSCVRNLRRLEFFLFFESFGRFSRRAIGKTHLSFTILLCIFYLIYVSHIPLNAVLLIFHDLSKAFQKATISVFLDLPVDRHFDPTFEQSCV